MSRKRISPTLLMEGRSICCAACGHGIATAGQPWKPYARLVTRPAASLPGAGSALHPEVVIRSFACPECAALLDSEVALPGDPFLNDVVPA